MPIWKAVPKNPQGRIEGRTLRYLAHRFFHGKSSIVVRGFEPSRPVNASSWGREDILSQKVPDYVAGVLESRHAQDRGFDLQDAVQMVATLEQLIFDSESTLLEQTFQSRRLPVTEPVTRGTLVGVLEEYMLRWLMSGDEEGIKAVVGNPRARAQTIPHYHEVMKFSAGQIKALDFQRQRGVAGGVQRRGRGSLAERYSFEDAHEVVGGITKTFASYWETECQTMKDALVKLDTRRTGRVSLKTFYRTSLNGESRFAESEAYLRELGALDETSTWAGKQVIISNYIQGVSNCILSTPHYLVCCVSECESLLGEIEAAVGEPLALPGQLLALVRNMTSQTSLDDDFAPNFDKSLASQLEQIAQAHGGRVPLHGRLFTQWLHYAFPWECPFPHKTGVASTLTPGEFGDGMLATKDDMTAHALSSTSVKGEEEESHWMSQWSEEEELMTDYSHLHGANWGRRCLAIGGAVLLLAAMLTGVAGSSKNRDSLLPTHAKGHYV